MTAIRRLAWGAALAVALSVTLVAQQAPSGYHQDYCAKVKPGRGAAFDAVLNGDAHKLAQADIDSGRISGWIVLQAVEPQGKEAHCDIVAVLFFPGVPPEPRAPAANTAFMQKTIGKTPAEYIGELQANSTLVSSDISQQVAMVGEAKKGDYVGILSINATNAGAWMNDETTLIEPVMKQLLQDGAISGWATNRQIYPTGGEVANITSANIFPTVGKAVTAGEKYVEAWKKVHPDIGGGEGRDMFAKAGRVEYTALYKIEDLILPPKK